MFDITCVCLITLMFKNVSLSSSGLLHQMTCVYVTCLFVHRAFNLGFKLFMKCSSLANLAEILSECILKKWKHCKFRVIFATLMFT